MTCNRRLFLALGLALAVGTSTAGAQDGPDPIPWASDPFARIQVGSYVKGRIYGLGEPFLDPATGNTVVRILQVQGWPTLDQLRELASGQWLRIDFGTVYDSVEAHNLLVNMAIAGIPWRACDDLDDCWSDANSDCRDLPSTCPKCVPPGASCSGVKYVSKSAGGGCTATCNCTNNAEPTIEDVCSRPTK